MKITVLPDTEIQITREFDASRDIVFKAMTDPALLARWWGPRRYKTVVDTMDVRPGGKWRMRNIAAAGSRIRGACRVRSRQWQPEPLPEKTPRASAVC